MQNTIDCHETLWEPRNVIDCPPSHKHAVVVLNRTINLAKDILLPLWEKAEVTVTVDGGTDRWMEYLGNTAINVYQGENSIYLPTLITGDMDSIKPETREKLSNLGSNVIETMDQNLTDYTKALIKLSEYCESQKTKLNEIYVIIDTSGRFDHIIGNINTLYKTSELFTDTQVIQIASDSLTWLLKRGRHRIVIPKVLAREKSWCGLLPFTGKMDNVRTTGLKWNLDNLSMGFGGLVSTSNTYENECEQVTIVLDDPLVWTMGIESLIGQGDSS